MSLAVAGVLFGIGLGLVLVASEQLVESTIGVSHQAGLSAFVISVVFIGFDPENLAVGAVASYDGTSGLALGTIVGAAMVALVFAFGATAVLAPMEFDETPRRILAVPLGAVLLLGGLALDGTLSRPDGVLLLIAYAAAVVLLLRWERRGLHVAPTEGVKEELKEERSVGLRRSIVWFVASLAGVIAGSELLVRGARPLVQALGWTETLFGMTILALVVSVEEVARELPAALKGRPDITYGNVVGSALAFFCFNAGVIALVRPVPIDPITQRFYIPVALGSVVVITLLMDTGRVRRWGGALLLAIYAVFVGGGFLL